MKKIVVLSHNFDRNRMLIIFVVSTFQNFPVCTRSQQLIDRVPRIVKSIE